MDALWEEKERGKSPLYEYMYFICICGFIGIMDNLPFTHTFNNTVLNSYQK